MSQYDDDADRLTEPCANCGQPNYLCRCEHEPQGSCERCGCDLYDGDDFEHELCGQCEWWLANSGSE